MLGCKKANYAEGQALVEGDRKAKIYAPSLGTSIFESITFAIFPTSRIAAGAGDGNGAIYRYLVRTPETLIRSPLKTWPFTDHTNEQHPHTALRTSRRGNRQ
jgi:hypothetical protein